VIFSIEIVHYLVLSVDQFVDVGHEVPNGFGWLRGSSRTT
jgi:hypothetical protein